MSDDSDSQWVHATNASSYSWGDIIGWRDDSSPTGYWSGVVQEVDTMALRVRVRHIKPGVLSSKRPS